MYDEPTAREQASRILALQKLMAKHDIVMPASGHQHPTSATEDLEPYVTGVESIDGPWCAITTGRDGQAFTYLHPGFESADGAAAKATEHLRSDIYPEWPEAIVNLDTGEWILPTVTWPVTSKPVESIGGSQLPDPPEDLADAWRRFQAGERVEPYEARKLDEWRGDCAADAGF